MKLQKGDKVIVLDPGLLGLYNIMKQYNPNCKPSNQGWVEEFYDNDDTILIKFPIGDDNPDEHSQVAPYPRSLVVRKDW